MKNEELVTSNMPLVWHIAKRYRNTGYEYNDLVQEGYIGLIAAAEQFDPDRGFRFSTLAGRCIENKIRAYIRSQRKHKRCVVSLDQEICEDGSRLEEVIGFWQKETEELWKQEYLERAVSFLDEEEKTLIWQYYWVRVKQVELARMYGVSQAQICRRLKRILAKMKCAAE